MIYLVKLQPTHALVGLVLSSSKHGGTIYQILSPNFHHRRLTFSNIQEFSTYVSALKTLPLKKKILRKKENILNNSEAIDLLKLDKMLRTTKKEMKILRKTQNFVEKTENNYGFESTQSYDPNLLDHNVELEKFFKYGSNKTLENNDLKGSAVEKEEEEIVKKDEADHKKHATNRFSSKNTKKSLLNHNKKLGVLEQKYGSHSKLKLFTLQSLSKLDKDPILKEAFEELEEMEKRPEKAGYKIQEEKEAEQPEESVAVFFKKYSELLTLHRQLVQLLHSSIDIRVTNDSVLKAFELMSITRKKNYWKYVVAREQHLVDVYNTLLHGLSEKGHWNFMQEVITWMAMDNVKLDSESFAALFYALTKLKNFGNEKYIEDEIGKILNQLFVNNISLNDIFSKTILGKEKAEKILALIQEVVPSFEIEPVTINLSSDCPLVKNLIETNNNLESPIDNVGIETMKNLIEEQLLLENQFLIKVKAVCRNFCHETSEESKKRILNLKKEWRRSIEDRLQNILVAEKRSLTNNNLYVYINSIPTEKLVDILMDTTINLVQFSKGYSPSTSQISFTIGNKIASCYQLRKKEINKTLDKTKDLFKHYLSWYLDPSGPARNSRQKWQMLIQDSDKTCHLDSPVIKWPDELKKNLGKYLLELIVKEVKFPIGKKDEKKFFPVLCTVLRYREGAWREEIKCHPVVSELYRRLGFDTISYRADQMPMVCPPKPWKSVEHGGYLFLPTDFIRKSNHTMGKVLKLKNVPSQQMFPSFDALNALQAIPWMVNEDVLDVALEVFQNGGSKKLNVPHYPKPLPSEFNRVKGATFQERWEENLKRRKVLKARYEEYGLWCEALYRLSLANHFRKRFFWLPQNCDFRGRVYPVPTYLNHTVADLYRSLLIFAKGKPLGPDGLDWLKIHIINLTGTHKQKSVMERLAYANEILPLILDSAEEPLKGNKWWTESEEPWQTLAGCIEIKKALSVPNPENYVCRFPVHQDGSCNGLQHYAGLGKDLIGAESVNLASSETPQDVYTAVARLIEEERVKDANNGIEIAIKLKGFISRKVVKQTIMTTVYGVTLFGAKEQISKKLEEIPDFSKEYIRPAAAYLTNKTFFCLKKMFSSAKEIQDWFVGCANAISSKGDYVQWMAPLGLPVLQGYGREKFHFNSRKNYYFRLPDIVKQRNAFPPNFIHSLDSSHMMLTALFCEQAGITFAAVHDCFWTHPISVGPMSKICREQFISLHSQPILENLSQFFIRNYLKNDISNNRELANIFEAVPAKGSFDLREVLNSVYFFN